MALAPKVWTQEAKNQESNDPAWGSQEIMEPLHRSTAVG